MSNKYVELGAGFFLTDIDSFTLEVCDANSVDPDVYYGPLAWNGGVGPASSRRLVLVEPAEANAYMAAMMAYDRDEGEHPGDIPSWPATATVSSAGFDSGLGDLHGRQFDSEEALVKAVRRLTRSMPRKIWSGSSSAARLESLKFATERMLGSNVESISRYEKIH
ncbi:hypothetical protein [Cupriavidus sp. L7L]|uniref:hypothetical protein n=2 Tax=Cupriavidus sp. L7L TaxID=2546443 RepID=UPI001054D916|nr:hypothetical protein [Cupriavidus sp. L7L]TDF56128.1 hypothetical protein E1J61_36175 [Cupriavidus sp. L7L]